MSVTELMKLEGKSDIAIANIYGLTCCRYGTSV